MKPTWSRLLEQLVLVRLGQELGTDSEIAQAVAGAVDFASMVLSRFFS